MLKKSQKVLRKAWIEKFFILSNIGLIYMDQPGLKDCKLLPLFDFEVVEQNLMTDYMFEIKTTKGRSYNLQMKAKGLAEYEDWMAAFKKFKEHLAKSQEDRLKVVK